MIKVVIILVIIGFISSFSLVSADVQIPFWVEERIRYWHDGKLANSDLDTVLNWLAYKNQIKPTYDLEQKLPSDFKKIVSDWKTQKISNDYFYQKIYSGLKNGSIKPSSKTKFDFKDYSEIKFSGRSELFRVYAYKKDFIETRDGLVPIATQFEKYSNQTENYKKITNSGKKVVVIRPIFTASAYYEPGFYTYFRGQCDEKCLTTTIKYGYPYGYSASANANKILRLLNYTEITDIDVDKNPKILDKYNTVILLHNEYVTQKEFDAITKHPHVLYLYPNALYGKISTNYDKDTITLLRGHGFPKNNLRNGFDWKYDNSDFEYDKDCQSWKFVDIPNGRQLNCYPQNIIYHDYKLLKAIKDY